MSRRFQNLLDRYAIIRRAFDAERQQPRPSLIRLARLNRLQLVITARIRAFVEQSAIRRASAPRLASYPPAYAYARPLPANRAPQTRL
jgi:hypothetical protein